jgi:hypothetical protein
MAYTRIHAIKSTVTKAVAYICNPDKTEQQLLVDSFGCSPETARHDFDYALSRTKQSDKNQAYHLIQSFAKGEVSHEEALNFAKEKNIDYYETSAKTGFGIKEIFNKLYEKVYQNHVKIEKVDGGEKIEETKTVVLDENKVIDDNNNKKEKHGCCK